MQRSLYPEKNKMVHLQFDKSDSQPPVIVRIIYTKNALIIMGCNKIWKKEIADRVVFESQWVKLKTTMVSAQRIIVFIMSP